MDKTNFLLKAKSLLQNEKMKKCKKKKKKKECKGRCINTNKKNPVKLSSLGMLIRSPIFLIEI